VSLLTPEPFGRWQVPTLRQASGPPVLFVHGSADSPAMWRGVMKQVPDHERIALDIPNAVEDSDPPPTLLGSCLERDYEILSDVVDAFDRPALVAHSYGALLALRFALRRRDALSALVLIEPIAFGLIRDAGPVYDAVSQACAFFVDSFDPRNTGPGLGGLVDYWNGPGTWDSFPDPTRARLQKGAMRTRAEVLAGDQDRTRADELEGLHTPTHVILGENTTAAARAVCWQLASNLPNAGLHRIEDAGHQCARTHATPVAAVVNKALGYEVTEPS